MEKRHQLLSTTTKLLLSYYLVAFVEYLERFLLIVINTSFSSFGVKRKSGVKRSFSTTKTLLKYY